MYGLVQVVIIVHEEIKDYLKPYGYEPERIPQVLWTHQNRDIIFTLVVDYFLIKYRSKRYAKNLISALQSKYEVTQDWTGGL